MDLTFEGRTAHMGEPLELGFHGLMRHALSPERLHTTGPLRPSSETEALRRNSFLVTQAINGKNAFAHASASPQQSTL